MDGSHKARSGEGDGSRVREYYARVADYIDVALTERGDEPFWRRVGRRVPGTALEIGAGTGRVTRLLAPDRELLVAIDLSPRMLRRARRALRGFPSAHLLACDVRDLRLAARFDLAVAANDPLSHLVTGSDRDRALERIAAHLAPRGRFFLDALWLSPGAAAAAAAPGGYRKEKRIEGAGREPLEVRELWRRRPGSRRCRVRYTYARGGRILTEAETEMRPWTPAEIRRRFRRAGLRPVSLSGDYEGSPWSRRTAEALVAEGERASSRS